jgi:hypothetical protein
MMSRLPGPSSARCTANGKESPKALEDSLSAEYSSW